MSTPGLCHPPPGTRALLACLLALALLLAGCAQSPSATPSPPGALAYYWSSLRGHWALLQAARPVSDWLADPATPAALRTRLALAQQMRDFASARLHLPDNASYRSYAELPRRAAVWNVVAAPPDALTLHQWCFPITGCIGYRGYFNEADAQAEAAHLAAQGLEVAVYGVPAYSTLGYLNWLGGDPLLSTFIHGSEGDLVRLLLHELAHQVLYAEGDTTFNESFATTVERLGTALWLQEHASAATRAQDQLQQAQRQQWRALTQATRARLAEIYAQKTAATPNQQAQAAMKKEAMEDFRRAYAVLRAQWQAAHPSQDLRGYDQWVAQANNARFATQAAYDTWVPALEALFQQHGGDWRQFYAAARQLAALPTKQRRQALCTLHPQPGVELGCGAVQ
ncbi:MAG: aminopeptidase [Paenacidovorax caeni]